MAVLIIDNICIAIKKRWHIKQVVVNPKISRKALAVVVYQQKKETNS